MISKRNNNSYTLSLLKINILLRIICVLIKIFIIRYHLLTSWIESTLSNIILITSIITNLIIAIQIGKIFHEMYGLYFRKNVYIEIFIETIILKFIFLIFFINQKITSQFVYYLTHLSTKAQENNTLLLIILGFLIANVYIYKILILKSWSFDKNSLSIRIKHISQELLIKCCIIVGVVIGFLDPILQKLPFLHATTFATNFIEKFEKYVTQYFHSYWFIINQIVTVIIAILICTDIYRLYALYKNKYKRPKETDDI